MTLAGSESQPEFITVPITAPPSSSIRKIAYHYTQRRNDRPGLVWLPGFKSDMSSTKVMAVDQWARENEISFLRFDYSGHGQSEGAFEAGTISRWLEEAHSLVDHLTAGPQILIGSSMGGWIALLIIRMMQSALPNGENQDEELIIANKKICAALLIAPAWDMTEALIKPRMDEAARKEMEQTGQFLRPSAYDDGPYPITAQLLEDGKTHLLGDESFAPACPIRILHGVMDPDVPWQHSIALMGVLQEADMQLTLVKDGEHRLSRSQDIALLLKHIETLINDTNNAASQA